MLKFDDEWVVEKVLLIKPLSTGEIAKVALVSQSGEYRAVLYLNDRTINGPSVPQPLERPTEEITHYIGNRPAVGLTSEQAQTITDTVKERNDRARRA